MDADNHQIVKCSFERTSNMRTNEMEEPSPVSDNLWYVKLGAEIRPYSLSKLKSSVLAGEIAARTSVRQGGSETWSFAEEFQWYTDHAMHAEPVDKPNPEINPLIQSLRNEYETAISVLDSDVHDLISSGKEMQALKLYSDCLKRIFDIKETLENFYTSIYSFTRILERFGSERLKILGHTPLPVRACYGNPEHVSEEIYLQISKELRSYSTSKNHWCLPSLPLMEIEYMLDTLEILIEVDYVPGESEKDSDEIEQSLDRYIPTHVKREVWRRDRGKCTSCGSNERLEYDHIIPIAKGGSNTERNVQLLCEKCNRAKSHNIQ